MDVWMATHLAMRSAISQTMYRGFGCGGAYRLARAPCPGIPDVGRRVKAGPAGGWRAYRTRLPDNT
jgi:hypothetical protein